jgi:hypothetical protein
MLEQFNNKQNIKYKKYIIDTGDGRKYTIKDIQD